MIHSVHYHVVSPVFKWDVTTEPFLLPKTCQLFFMFHNLSIYRFYESKLAVSCVWISLHRCLPSCRESRNQKRCSAHCSRPSVRLRGTHRSRWWAACSAVNATPPVPAWWLYYQHIKDDSQPEKLHQFVFVLIICSQTKRQLVAPVCCLYYST